MKFIVGAAVAYGALVVLALEAINSGSGPAGFWAASGLGVAAVSAFLGLAGARRKWGPGVVGTGFVLGLACILGLVNS